MGKAILIEKEKKRKKEKNIKIAVAIILIIILTALAIFAVLNYNTTSNNNLESGESGEVALIKPDKYQDVEENPVVTMEMANGGIVKIELYPQIAPTTVENFIYLINQGFYNGLTFHRVIPEFMAQGGDPNGDGTGGPGYTIVGEFSENGYENNLSHEVGVISMARSDDKDSAGSQFFIVTDEESYQSLDGKYAAFGRVIEGMDVVYDIVNVDVIRTEYSDNVQFFAYGLIQPETEEDYNELNEQYEKESRELNRPINPPVIKSMTVDTFGVQYDEPEKL